MKTQTNHSLFHEGEQVIQERLGVREEVEAIGSRFIRPYMPDQHRTFFQQLPFIVIGSVDEDGWPWASIVSGKPGFTHSPEPTTLNINTVISPHDPLSSALKPEAKLGLLGIEPSTRRRNRMNAYVKNRQNFHINLSVDQSFGNCPKYIQTRELTHIRPADVLSEKTRKIPFTQLDDHAKNLIRSADTFFVSSYVNAQNNKDIEGVDASHRGGKPGFIKLDGNTLTIPDFYGNNLFNTLGNFYKNPKAGLVFVDFLTGDLLMLTGNVELMWEDDPQVKNFNGAERAWTFHLSHGIWLTDFLPFRAPLNEYSPFLESIGEWQNQSHQKGDRENDSWQTLYIEKIRQESINVKSFYLRPLDTTDIPAFKPGQFLPIRLQSKVSSSNLETSNKPSVRTYTISSSSNDTYLRISVKREQRESVSQWLHDEYKVGDTIEYKRPNGQFFINTKETRPVTLIAGGIGITPILAMANSIFENNKKRKIKREVQIFYSAKSAEERAFHTQLKSLQLQSKNVIQYIPVISQVHNDDNQESINNTSKNHLGRIDLAFMKKHLKRNDCDFYLCGPSGFMQNCYDILLSLGVSDQRISAETFGVSTLTRTTLGKNQQSTHKNTEADSATIEFTQSKHRIEWQSGGPTLLELAEQKGIDAEFSCRNGSCGTCSTNLISGEVTYSNEIDAPQHQGQVLICCAKPKKGTTTLKLDL